jgi:hypothetical protein
MCWRIGIQWLCRHEWSDVVRCTQHSCGFTENVTPNGREHDIDPNQDFFRVPWDCCSECCIDHMDYEKKVSEQYDATWVSVKQKLQQQGKELRCPEVWNAQNAKYYQKQRLKKFAQWHVRCLDRFIGGFGMSVQMRQQENWEYEPIDVVPDFNDAIDETVQPLQVYKDHLATNGHFHASSRTVAEQYWAIKQFVAANPGLLAKPYFRSRPPPHFVTRRQSHRHRAHQASQEAQQMLSDAVQPWEAASVVDQEPAFSAQHSSHFSQGLLYLPVHSETQDFDLDQRFGFDQYSSFDPMPDSTEGHQSSPSQVAAMSMQNFAESLPEIQTGSTPAPSADGLQDTVMNVYVAELETIEQKLSGLDRRISGLTWEEEFQSFQKLAKDLKQLGSTHKFLKELFGSVQPTKEFDIARLATVREQLQEVGRSIQGFMRIGVHWLDQQPDEIVDALLNYDMTGFVRGYRYKPSILDPNRFPASPPSNQFLDHALQSAGNASRQAQETGGDPQQVAGSINGKGKAAVYQ